MSRLSFAGRRSPVAALALILASASPLTAQSSPPEAEVMAVITRLFDAMRTRDTAVMRSLLDPQARMTSSFVRQGQPTVQAEGIENWISGVGRAPDTLVLDERIWSPEVRVDDNLAHVWVPYAFYINNRFSHCGVDSFQLARGAQGWRIVAVADTRRRDRCNEPARPGGDD